MDGVSGDNNKLEIYATITHYWHASPAASGALAKRIPSSRLLVYMGSWNECKTEIATAPLLTIGCRLDYYSLIEWVCGDYQKITNVYETIE